MPDEKFIVFQIASHHFALSLNDVREILLLPQLLQPPGMPSLLDGLLQYGRKIVPVLRLDRLFNCGEQVPGLYSHLVVVKVAPTLQASHQLIAILVDNVSQIVELSAEKIAPIQKEDSFNQCAIGTIHLHHPVTLLACHQIILESERKVIEEFVQMEEKRLAALSHSDGTPNL
jgi:purine-binding chemotaxis protein CheW